MHHEIQYKRRKADWLSRASGHKIGFHNLTAHFHLYTSTSSTPQLFLSTLEMNQLLLRPSSIPIKSAVTIITTYPTSERARRYIPRKISNRMRIIDRWHHLHVCILPYVLYQDCGRETHINSVKRIMYLCRDVLPPWYLALDACC